MDVIRSVKYARISCRVKESREVNKQVREQMVSI